MADTIMADGERQSISPLSSPVTAGSPMQILLGIGTASAFDQRSGLAALQHLNCTVSAGSSPGKYIAPRLRRSVSPVLPATVLSKRPLATDDSPKWQDKNIFFPAAIVDSIPLNSSPPNLSPPPPPPPPKCRWLIGATCHLTLEPTSPHREATLLIPAQPTPESGPPATPAYRRLFRTVCRATTTAEIFEGAWVKHGRFSAASLSTSLLDYIERGLILSFSHRAPSYDHFRVWIDSHLSQAGIMVDDASELGNDFFLLLLQDQANEQSALKHKFFFLNKYVDIFPWSPAFAPQELSNKTHPIWVELTNLHPSLRLRSAMEAVITENLGPVLYFPETKTLVHHTNPRILICWTMQEEIIDFLSLDDQGDTLLQQVTFLNHPQCCHNCKKPGHMMKDCTNPPHFRNDMRGRFNPPQSPLTPVGSPVVDSQEPASQPDSGPLVEPVPADGTTPIAAPFQVCPNVNSAIPFVPTSVVPTLNISVLGPTEESLLGDGHISDFSVPPVHLPIRTTRSVVSIQNIHNPEELANPDPVIQSPILADADLIRVSPKPLSPGLSSQGNSAGSKRWADYSSDSDDRADPSTNSPGGSRSVLSPHRNISADHQCERSPTSIHRYSQRFSIKAAARHSKRSGRGAGRRGKQ
ncbi:unnamed protein product [Calypogeia fissa]